MINQPHFSEEEEIANLVRTTLQTAAQTDNRRLKQLMPAVPKARQKHLSFKSWQRQLAVVCTMVLLCVGMFGLYQVNQQPVWQGPPTALAITATYTTEPTVTENSNVVVTETVTAVETQAAVPLIPRAAATPIAALSTGNLARNKN